MITNLDIDDALAAQLESAAKARGICTRDFIRNALRHALTASSQSIKPTLFVQRVHDFGTHIETPWTLLADIEGEEHFRKYARK
jgi:hypothetical protein